MNKIVINHDQTFTMIIERDPESGWLVGEVVELRGCMTEAPDLVALERAIQEAIGGYLDVADLEEPLSEFIGTMRIKVAS